MGICTSNKSNRVHNQDNHHEIDYKPFIFDTSIVPEQQPQVNTKQTNTVADRIIPQHNNTDQTKTEYDRVFQEMQKKQQAKFEDSKFPPDKCSLSSDPNFQKGKNIVWKRPDQFLEPGQIKLFDTIDPMDIKQGELGDCYFLSSLSALAEIPQQVQKLFRHQEYQQNGLYGIFMCNNGILQECVVDDYIPCNQKGYPIFSKANGNELWVLLLEKAYAKIYGSYNKIEQGLAGYALKDLTGAPSEYFIRKAETLEDANLCWDFMEKNDKEKYILTASSETNEQGMEQDNGNGIVSQHCYAILDLQKVIASDGQPDRIIRIRNPWGRKEWTKDWSDSSSKWTPELRERLQVQQRDDGIFWMSVNDFITEFSSVCVCKFKPDYLYTATPLKVQKSDGVTKKVILMKVYEQAHAFISLTQSDKRFFQKGHQYSLARLIIGQLETNKKEVLHYSGSAFENERDIVVEKVFEPGYYALYVEVDWTQNYDRYLAVSCYGSKSVQFSELEFTAGQEKLIIDNIFDGFLRAHERDTDEEKVKDIEPGIRRISGMVGGYLYYWYQNQTTIKTLHEILQLNKIQNLEICPPYQNPNEVKIQCNPLSTVMVKYRVTKQGGGSFGYSLKSQTSVIQVKSEQDIIQQAIQQADQKVQRSIEGQNIQVFFYIVKYPAGVAFYYENKESRIYQETIQLEVSNLKGVELDITQDVVIEIPPGQSKLIQLQSIDPSQGYSYKYSISYTLM
ncbi:unnamed protein product [Paramecium pentaurelia]|uniref:Calpain catalytic domain-containing protein n=1 Tax=Paramecium pentaurelia TaxID=43138 RepID=A0A8S1WKV8_9CILI|nr:unnamed protein product [Paramecium pentaurelia]